MTHTFSSSQIVAYNECKRKWAWSTIAKVPRSTHPSAALGTETHKQLETYLEGGQLDYTKDSAYIAAEGLRHLPPPKTPNMVLEGRFRFQSPNTGFWYAGIRDVYIPGNPPLIIDHKTTSSLKWAKTPEDLLTDVQAVIYAYVEAAPVVDLMWLYLQTKGARKSLPVLQTMTREHTSLQFAKVELTAAEMGCRVEESQGQPLEDYVLSLPPNPSACEQYGGCPYRHKCNLGPIDHISSLFGRDRKLEEDMSAEVSSLIARLRAQTAPPPPPPFTVDPINPPLPPPPPPPLAETIIPPSMETVPAPEPPKRGRPRKAPTPEPVPTVIPAEIVPKGYVLYVDCVPTGHFVDACEIYEAANKAVKEKSGVSDYRLVEYGAGPGLLALAVQDLISSGSLEGDKVVVSTAQQETVACLSVLVRGADSVVRSVR